MIVVTGATGFIGLRLVKRILKTESPSKIVCLVWKNNSAREKAARKILSRLKVKIVPVDLVTGFGLDKLPHSPELVIHLAANSDTASSDFRCNDVGTKNLLSALGKLGPKTHFVYTSTTISMSGRKNCRHSFDERTKPVPTNEYGRTKVRGEIILKNASKKNNFRLTIVRMPTVYGFGARKDNLFEFLNKLLAKKSFLTRLNWPGFSGFIYVDDVVEAIWKLTKKSGKPNLPRIFILSAENITLSEVLSLMYKIKGQYYNQIVLPRIFWQICAQGRKIVPLFEKTFPSPIYNYLWRASLIVDDVIYCDTTKIKSYLPEWKPKKLEEVIKEVTL